MVYDSPPPPPPPSYPPPPPPPSPPRSVEVRPVESRLSTTRETGWLSGRWQSWSGAFCIDNNYATLCATTLTSAGKNWASVRVPPATTVRSVHVYNRRDFNQIQFWLGTIQVYLGASPGQRAALCGQASYPNAVGENSPYVFDCSAASGGPWVTVVQTACPSICILALAEIRVFGY